MQRSFHLKIFAFADCLLAFALIAAANPTATAQQTPAISQVQGVLTGPRFTVYDTKNACKPIDIPDAPARAFRDYPCASLTLRLHQTG